MFFCRLRLLQFRLALENFDVLLTVCIVREDMHSSVRICFSTRPTSCHHWSDNLVQNTFAEFGSVRGEAFVHHVLTSI
jgi:hypothetical protein